MMTHAIRLSILQWPWAPNHKGITSMVTVLHGTIASDTDLIMQNATTYSSFFVVFTMLPVHGYISSCFLHKKDTYAPVPCVSSPVENRSCPESTRCCSQCVLPLSWCQSVLDGWVMAEWLRRWLKQWAARGVSKILGSPVQHWHPPHEANNL